MRGNFFLSLLGLIREEFTDSLRKRITWGANWAVIGILDPTQSTPTNFEISEHFCGVSTDSLINGEALDIRAQVTQVREGREVGRLDKEEGDLRPLKENIFIEAKLIMEQACKGGV